MVVTGGVIVGGRQHGDWVSAAVAEGGETVPGTGVVTGVAPSTVGVAPFVSCDVMDGMILKMLHANRNPRSVPRRAPRRICDAREEAHGVIGVLLFAR